jgi:hypothetical protein
MYKQAFLHIHRIFSPILPTRRVIRYGETEETVVFLQRWDSLDRSGIPYQNV